MANFWINLFQELPKKEAKNYQRYLPHKNQNLMTISLQLSTHIAHKIQALLQDMKVYLYVQSYFDNLLAAVYKLSGENYTL